MTEEAAIHLVRKKLIVSFDVQKIILFGSRARGDHRADSDFDFLVLANSAVPFVKRQGMGLLALGKRDFTVDLLIYTPSEAEHAASIPGSALYWAEREGRVVFAT